MFGLCDDVWTSNGVKVIDGIAGGGKSSMIDNHFRKNNITYSRFTSTNRLRRDAMDRYCMPVKTIAAGLFHNHGTNFYAEEREPDCNVVVIDEILQTHPKVINWCENHSDNTSIIVTTDSKQLMSPDNEIVMKNAFNDLCKKPSTIYTTVDKTLRARNEETKALYEKFYKIADSPIAFSTKELTDMFPHISYSEMDYNVSDSYITHDNATEDFLYKDLAFTSNPALDLIPKGCLSSKPPKDLFSYPILSQLEAERTHTRSYVQVMNVGSAIRFQGSEVDNAHKLYYLVQPTSMVSARELYTVITRMWDIGSFNIVVINTPKAFKLSTFRGLPVKTHKYLTVNEIGNTIGMSSTDMERFVSSYDTDEIFYNRDEVKGADGNYRYVRIGARREASTTKKSTAASLAKRDGKLNYSYMDEVYSILEKQNVLKTKCIHASGKRNDWSYEVDVFSAHPTMLKFEKMPIDGILKTDAPHDDMLNFYLYRGENFTNESVITDDMANYITENNLGTCTYLFSTPYTIGCFPGNWLYKKAHDTVESKKAIKSVHYGYYQKPYLTLAPNNKCYVRYENHIYELLICAIFSQLLYYMIRLKKILDGTSIVIDAVKFMCYNENTIKDIKSILPDYVDFRIRSADGTILYQTYADLKTKQEKHNEQKREKYKNMTQEERDKRNARKRELRRLKKEALKNGETV